MIKQIKENTETNTTMNLNEDRNQLSSEVKENPNIQLNRLMRTLQVLEIGFSEGIETLNKIQAEGGVLSREVSRC